LADIVRPSLFDEVLHTRFGEVELLRIALCVAYLPALIVLRRSARLGRGDDVSQSRPTPVLVAYGAVVGLGLLATPGLAGHASSGGGVVLGMALDIGHLAGVAVWLGGLAVLACLLLPGGLPADRPAEVGQIARRFSTYAFGAVVVIVATGVVQSLREVGSFYALFHTTYGRTLIVKVALVVAMVGAAAFSRRYVGRIAAVPQSRGGDAPIFGPAPARGNRFARSAAAVLTRPARPVVVENGVDSGGAGAQWARRAVRKLRRSVLAEAALALAVLTVTSLLVNAVPAKQAAAQPFTHTFDVLGIQVNAVIGPARVGSDNQFHFYVLGRLGQPQGIPELDASISLPGQGVGPIAVPLRVGGPGHYLATGVAVPLAGVWDLKLTVRTSPIDEQEVFADVPVR
jgi:copper transport protein